MHFNRRAWIYFPKHHNVRGLSKAIQECLIEQNTGPKMHSRLLVVLDDILNEDPNVLDRIRGLPCLNGAKIVVTTRSENVARNIKPSIILRLQGLSPEDCWLLFQKYAFDGPHLDAYAHMVDIGRKIVQNCGGLPLAVKTLGNLLRSQRDEDKWTEVLNSDIWRLDEFTDVMMPVLRRSYNYMPHHLKPYFAYCSLFPKGYKFKGEELVRSWMAQGYVRPRGSETLEDLGIEYLYDLQMSSFFQDDVQGEPTDVFTMHDAVHSRAQYISRDDCCMIEDQERVPGDLVELPSEVRHVYLASSKPRIPVHPGSLRTYRHTCTLPDCLYMEIPDDIFQNLKFLQVLDLNCMGLKELPDSIGNLIHLRYLCLKSSIKWLPESICHLYNLQTLDLLNCKDLIELPTAIGNLVNLRHLDLPVVIKDENSSANDLSVSSARIPSGIGKLVSLQALVGICVGKDCGIEELERLAELEGNLCISGLRNVDKVDDARTANLREKKHLRMLKFEWPNSGLLDEDVEQNVSGSTDFAEVTLEEAVLESLQPHTNLTVLIVKGYNGSIFPRWISDPSFKLTTIVLVGGKQSNCNFFPVLGGLPSLKCIGWMNKIRTMGREFCCLLEKDMVGALAQWSELCSIGGKRGGSNPASPK